MVRIKWINHQSFHHPPNLGNKLCCRSTINQPGSLRDVKAIVTVMRSVKEQLSASCRNHLLVDSRVSVELPDGRPSRTTVSTSKDLSVRPPAIERRDHQSSRALQVNSQAPVSIIGCGDRCRANVCPYSRGDVVLVDCAVRPIVWPTTVGV